MSKARISLEPADSIEVKVGNGSSFVFRSKEVIGFTEGKVSRFGNSAKINFSKEFAGNKVYIVVCKKERGE